MESIVVSTAASPFRIGKIGRNGCIRKNQVSIVENKIVIRISRVEGKTVWCKGDLFLDQFWFQPNPTGSSIDYGSGLLESLQRVFTEDFHSDVPQKDQRGLVNIFKLVLANDGNRAEPVDRLRPGSLTHAAAGRIPY